MPTTLASVYLVLLGIGAVPVAERTFAPPGRDAHHRRVLCCRRLRAGERDRRIAEQRDHRPQSRQGETVGWPQFVDTVAQARQAVPAAQHATTVIFTAKYGEADAIDLLGPAHALPRAFSGHNRPGQWGRPTDIGSQVLLVGYASCADAAPQVTPAASSSPPSTTGSASPMTNKACRCSVPPDRELVRKVATADPRHLTVTLPRHADSSPHSVHAVARTRYLITQRPA